MNSKNKSISTSLPTGEDKQFVVDYAISRGYGNVSNLLRVALVQFFTRNKIKLPYQKSKTAKNDRI